MLDPLLTRFCRGNNPPAAAARFNLLVGLAQQQGATIGTDRAPIKPGHDLTLPTGFSIQKLDWLQSGHSRGRSLFVLKHLLVEVFRLDWTAFGYITREISGLVLAVAAYNLTRATMNQAASALQFNPRELSYSLAQDTIHAFSARFRQRHYRTATRGAMQEMLRVLKCSAASFPTGAIWSPYERAIWPRRQIVPASETCQEMQVIGKT